jgi:hypothetical protein
MYWFMMLYIAFSGSTFALIGILSAALSPFVLVVRCPPPEEVSGSANALGLWISIRGFMIALMIMSIAEYMSSKDSLSILSYEPLEKAMLLIEKSLKLIWRDRDPEEAIEQVPKLLTDARTYSKAAEQEPRFWRCQWKSQVVLETAEMMEYLRLHIQTMRHAMRGLDGETGGVFEVLNQVQAFTIMKNDLLDTYEDATELTMLTLKHEAGPFKGLSKLNTLKGIDSLDGFDQAIEDVNNLDSFTFPKEEITTLEDDLLCQVSIIFVMLDFALQRVATILKSNVRKA